MKFTLEIELGNDAMQTMHQLGLAVRTVGHLITTASNRKPSRKDRAIIRDMNGNTVGKWEVSD